jgi:hypothetical protein
MESLEAPAIAPIRTSSTETPLTRIFDNPTRETSCGLGRNKQFDHCNVRVGVIFVLSSRS